jgi:hypothetical protein
MMPYSERELWGGEDAQGRRHIGPVLGALVAGSLVGQVAAAERVDLDLVLLADAAGSIDDAEIHFQRQGYASAITHPAVLDAILQGYDQRIAVTYVEMGCRQLAGGRGPLDHHRRSGEYCRLRRSALDHFRRAFGRNAIGNAIAVAQALIEGNQIEGHRKVIDVSADSANNWDGLSIAAVLSRWR